MFPLQRRESLRHQDQSGDGRAWMEYLEECVPVSVVVEDGEPVPFGVVVAGRPSFYLGIFATLEAVSRFLNENGLRVQTD